MGRRGDGHEVVQYVSFVVDERLFGVDIRLVKEINPNVAINPVPRTRPQIRGLVNIRGQVVLVIDIAVVLGRGPRRITPDSHIVILKTASELLRIGAPWPAETVARFGDKPIAFLVDRIRDVVTVDAGELGPVPRHLSEGNAKCFEAVVRLGDEVQLVLNPVALL